ncbi:MAG: hypothetical protein ABS81_00615 [Pseudonocardia sp. SCN 72-86]|nr:MAG: hypothetical protein ABS81_00615 [Pseudonocardia sp. SCN 72-86]
MSDHGLSTLRIGAKFVSRTCSTQVVVVRAPAQPVDLRCGGVAMTTPAVPAVQVGLQPGYTGGTVVGKRYVAPEIGLEVMCVRAGDGSVAVGSRLLELKSATPLPTSD